MFVLLVGIAAALSWLAWGPVICENVDGKTFAISGLTRLTDIVQSVRVYHVCLGFLLTVGVYLLAAFIYAKSGLNTFYVTLPINRFAFVTKGGEVVGIIYNSKNMKLIECDGYPLGKFVDLGARGKVLQTLGPVERLLGIRFVGVPFIHGLLERRMSWFSVEGGKFVEHKDEPITTFAITKTFGFKLPELVLGRDSDKDKPGKKQTGDDQKLERILVNILLMLQGTIDDPHLAIIATNWMNGVQGKLMRFVQAFLGHTSQDELIEQRAPKKSEGGEPVSEYCDLVQEIIDNIGEIQVYGVTFESKKITYVDYELAGKPEDIEKIRIANTTRYVKNQEAAGIKAVKRANQEDMLAQQEILLSTIKKLIKEGMSPDQAERISREMLRTKGLSETKLGTLVESGSNVTAAISTGKGGKP